MLAFLLNPQSVHSWISEALFSPSMASAHGLLPVPAPLISGQASRTAPGGGSGWGGSTWSANVHNRLQDFVKSALLQQLVPPGATVCDLYCGRGMDTAKWVQAQIGRYVGVDLASSALEEARERWDSLGRPYPADFCELDPCMVDLQSHLQHMGLPADIVCCMGHLQDSFLSEDVERRFLQNVASLLKPGGYFFGTTTDSSTIWSKYQKAVEGALKAGSLRANGALPRVNSGHYMISFEDDRFTTFGTKYILHFTDGLPPQNQILVHFPSLIRLAEEVGLEYIEIQNLLEFYEDYRIFFGDAVQRTCGSFFDSKGRLPLWAHDVLSLYTTFIFKKADHCEPGFLMGSPFLMDSDHLEPLPEDVSLADAALDMNDVHGQESHSLPLEVGELPKKRESCSVIQVRAEEPSDNSTAEDHSQTPTTSPEALQTASSWNGDVEIGGQLSVHREFLLDRKHLNLKQMKEEDAKVKPEFNRENAEKHDGKHCLNVQSSNHVCKKKRSSRMVRPSLLNATSEISTDHKLEAEINDHSQELHSHFTGNDANQSEHERVYARVTVQVENEGMDIFCDKLKQQDLDGESKREEQYSSSVIQFPVEGTEDRFCPNDEKHILPGGISNSILCEKCEERNFVFLGSPCGEGTHSEEGSQFLKHDSCSKQQLPENLNVEKELFGTNSKFTLEQQRLLERPPDLECGSELQGPLVNSNAKMCQLQRLVSGNDQLSVGITNAEEMLGGETNGTVVNRNNYGGEKMHVSGTLDIASTHSMDIAHREETSARKNVESSDWRHAQRTEEFQAADEKHFVAAMTPAVWLHRPSTQLPHHIFGPSNASQYQASYTGGKREVFGYTKYSALVSPAFWENEGDRRYMQGVNQRDDGPRHMSQGIYLTSSPAHIQRQPRSGGADKSVDKKWQDSLMKQGPIVPGIPVPGPPFPTSGSTREYNSWSTPPPPERRVTRLRTSRNFPRNHDSVGNRSWRESPPPGT